MISFFPIPLELFSEKYLRSLLNMELKALKQKDHPRLDHTSDLLQQLLRKKVILISPKNMGLYRIFYQLFYGGMLFIFCSLKIAICLRE